MTNEAELKNFFKAVITTESGKLLIASGDGVDNWWEEFFNYPKDVDKAIEYCFAQGEKYNVYFSAHLFNHAASIKANVLPSRTIQADLDDADLETIPIPPNVVIETSPNRHQAYWLLTQAVDLDTLEIYSRNLTYSIPLCDRSGWSLGHRMRVPYTKNYKRLPDVADIVLLTASPALITIDQLEQVPQTPAIAIEHYDQEWLDNTRNITLEIGPLELLETIKNKIPPKIYACYNLVQDDRSTYLWSLSCAAFRAGLDKDAIFWLAKHSANNKFLALKYNGDYELGKDILRAQEAVKSHITDIRTAINTIRKQRGHSLEKRQMISKLVIDRLKSEGAFIHADNGSLWYIRRDNGRPVQITRMSEYLRMLLVIEFGLNAMESEQHYVINELDAYTLNLPDTGLMSTLSYFDPNTPQHLYLHTGRQTLLRINKDTIDPCAQGYNSLVFPWMATTEQFIPVYDDSFDWAESLFGDSIKTIVDIPSDCAAALLKVWLLFIIFRQAAVARPILSLIGTQGAGKSTLFRKIYTVIYGRRRALTGLTNKEDFDHAVSTDSLVVLDNLDSLEQWLPDRLALIAASSDIIRRKLYTDIDTVVIRRQAILGITSHNPTFGREDVADRMLILNFKRLADDERISESIMLDELAANRNKVWGGIIKDIQRVLALPIPTDYPSFRIEDFSRIGMWIAQGIGVPDQFVKAISFVRESQSRLVLDEDQLLVDALMRYVVKQNGSGPIWESPATLYSRLEALTPDPQGFSRRYKSANMFGKKLVVFSEALKKIFNIENEYNVLRGSRLWKISRKIEV